MEEFNLPPTPITEDPPVSTRRPLLYGIAAVVVAFGLGLGAGYLAWARPLQARVLAAEQKVAALEKSAANPGQAEAADQQVKRYDVPVDNDPVLGNAQAPITIIEFSDYECPFCRRWHLEVLPQIQAKYGDQVRLVFRDFPLTSIHANAAPAAEAANCAGEQKRYWAFNELLFKSDKTLGQATYQDFAQQVGLDLEAFNQCVAERRYQQEVEDDLNYAGQLGVRSTPTFFVNGLAVVGAQPFEVFEQIIDLELAGKIPR